ncbi:CDP-4-dehydro-6-deoxyglucose reductase [Chitinophaga jiangningensis]|uniref:CDP-4-dehydro-6-deoxyglucose reductase n=1 Tax=Chitinophaga jiangningensis TaxID=1419482 RepID=A0A1M7DUJ3_9BACT|nr:FAD-binding oxidoreductase [Chitinophaga jiangningensis]SHL83162.1 CDP-4-dehydro-6-deoxyglucose reductase [Chitinophaga jiangningensis]
MVENWYTGIVTKIVDATHNTRRFWIKIPELERFDFKPGQFVTLDLPIHEKKNKRWRSYSIASHPDGSNEIELVIVLLEGGAGSTYLFNEIREGSELTLRGPLGVFVLPETLETEIFFICTGTGIAPFRAMSHYLKNHAIPHNGIHLLFGSRYEKDLLYADEMRQLEQSFPGFHYIPTLSRQEDWNGRKGYVHSIYEEMLQDKRPANFYLCGWKNMIDEAKQRILAMGYDRKQIHQELYG